ncbi:ABC transporter permease [Gorillibacterium massiliense]|uniref:ABC transporter permease n=1 Tax=Gorillibacterium massiliense TaxID=1280390 RepID=UPI0004B981CB|nr:ABC-2 family transporter protein [Gorillibacterium massiliense]
MLFSVLMQKSYRSKLQYRGSHLVQNIASSIFGFVYISIWVGIGEGRQLGEYGTSGMISYIAFNQAALWVAMFVNMGLGLPETVRTGQIAFDLLRPVHLFYQLMSREYGSVIYQFIYKSLPIFLLYLIVFSLETPHHFSTWLWTLAALLFASYINICINFLIGISALWTTESGWLHGLNYSFYMLLSGFFIPIEWLPRWLQGICAATPYQYQLYYPVRIYLERDSYSVLAGSVLWCFLLTLICLAVTVLARRRVEVQGG